MEEKDDSHLKCPEDTASISSNSVCLFFSFFLRLLFDLI
jgi:hypothetical protein